MKLYVLFAQLKESYEGEYAPDALEVLTEDSLDGNEEHLDTLKTEHTEKLGKDIVAIDWLTLEVDEGAVRRRLLPIESPIKTTLV